MVKGPITGVKMPNCLAPLHVTEWYAKNTSRLLLCLCKPGIVS